MKIFFLFFLFFSSKQVFSQVLIKGEISNFPKSKTVLIEPINDIHNYVINKKEYQLSLDDNGKFEKKLNLNSPVFLIIYIDMRPIWLFVEKNDTLEIKIHTDSLRPNSLNNAMIVKGKNALGNLFFNNYNYQPSWKILDFKDNIKSNGFYKTNDLNVLRKSIDKQVKPFRDLLSQNSISDLFFQYVSSLINDVLISQIARYYIYEIKQATFTEKIKYLQKLYDKFPLNEEFLHASVYNVSVAYNYYLFVAAKKYKKFDFKDLVISIGNKNLTINRNLIPWSFASTKIKEYYWALSLINLKSTFPDDYGEKDVNAYKYYFPNGEMLRYLAPPYFSKEEFHGNKIDSTGIKMVKEQNYGTINELYNKEFLNNPVFIDIWASWCVPCKQQFLYNKELDSVLENIKSKNYTFRLTCLRHKKMQFEIYIHSI